jgi:hypothetical protein
MAESSTIFHVTEFFRSSYLQGTFDNASFIPLMDPDRRDAFFAVGGGEGGFVF